MKPAPTLDPDLLALATPEEKRHYEMLLRKELMLRSPLDLASVLYPRTKRYSHIEYLNERVVALVEYRLYKSGPGPKAIWFYEDSAGDIHKVFDQSEVPDDAEDFWGENPFTGEAVLLRLAIAMPPRHGKSFIVSEWFPIWYWLRFPDRDQAFATYSDDFASDWGVQLRERLVEFEDQLGIEVFNGLRANSNKMRLTAETGGGKIVLVGVGGGLTGKGFQHGTIDDPFKDAAEAESPATRQHKGNWYTSTYETRKTRLPGKGVPTEILMFTRWNADDLAGRECYDEDGVERDDWYVLRLPALAEENDPLGREEGEALCPAIKTQRELLKMRDKDPYWFEALFQGNPSVREGGVISGWREYRTHVTEDGELTYRIHETPELPAEVVKASECVRFATVDTAGTKNSWSDWNVYSVWDFHRYTQRLFLVGFSREKLESVALRDWLHEQYPRWPGTTFVVIEDKTFGKTLIQTITREGGIPIRPHPAETDKTARGMAFGDYCRLGHVAFPTSGAMMHKWIQEHQNFPNGKHDDMVDTSSIAREIVLQMPKAVEREVQEPTAQDKIRKQIERKKNPNRRRGLPAW